MDGHPTPSWTEVDPPVGGGSATYSHAMVDSRPTWKLILAAAEDCAQRGEVPFKLSTLVTAVQAIDPTRERTSIQPIVQGMTVNAGKGPPAPCGKILLRVEHGYYTLISDTSQQQHVVLPNRSQEEQPNGRREPRVRRTWPRERRKRLDGLVAEFDDCVDEYDRSVPFTRVGQYELHRRTIDRRLALGSVVAAVYDDDFTESLYLTLQSWGIGRRRSYLVPLDTFRKRLQGSVDELADLDELALEDPALEARLVAQRLDRLITELRVVDNEAQIVAGTKTLHHLLPDLVPPMDRAYTGAFFGWSPVDPQNR